VPPTGSTCLIPTSLTVADTYDCDLVLPEYDINSDQMMSDQLQQQQQQQQHQHHYDDTDQCTTGQLWPMDCSQSAADSVMPGSSADMIEVNHGMRWATFRATGTGSPCQTVNESTALPDCLDVENIESPMTSFGTTRWNGVRTLFYEVPSHWQT